MLTSREEREREGNGGLRRAKLSQKKTLPPSTHVTLSPYRINVVSVVLRSRMLLTLRPPSAPSLQPAHTSVTCKVFASAPPQPSHSCMNMPATLTLQTQRGQYRVALERVHYQEGFFCSFERVCTTTRVIVVNVVIEAENSRLRPLLAQAKGGCLHARFKFNRVPLRCSMTPIARAPSTPMVVSTESTHGGVSEYAGG